MLEVDEAMSMVIREVQPLATETVPMMQCIGRCDSLKFEHFMLHAASCSVLTF